MKKILVFTFCVYVLSSCSLFRKSEKLGCRGDGRNIGAEKLAAEDPKALKESNKAKYKGGRKSFDQ